MSFTAQGKDLALTTRNAATGKFDLTWDASGNPAFDDTEAHAVLSLLYEHRGQWWADTAGTRGSRLYQLRNIRRSTPSQAESYASEALQPLVDARRILDVAPKARVQSGRVTLSVPWKTPGKVAHIAKVSI